MAFNWYVVANSRKFHVFYKLSPAKVSYLNEPLLQELRLKRRAGRLALVKDGTVCFEVESSGDVLVKVNQNLVAILYPANRGFTNRQILDAVFSTASALQGR